MKMERKPDFGLHQPGYHPFCFQITVGTREKAGQRAETATTSQPSADRHCRSWARAVTLCISCPLQLLTQPLRCPEYRISAAASQELVASCDNEPSHVARSRGVPAAPACSRRSAGLSLPGLARCRPGQMHPSAFLYARKRRNAHLLVSRRPALLTAAPTRVGDHGQLVFRGFTIFSCYAPCAGRAAALVSAPLGKRFDPRTPQWALGRRC